MKTSLIPLAIALVICSITVADDGDAPKDHPAKFKITTKRQDDWVELRVEKDKAVFSVHSPFGISQVVIERLEEMWPKEVMVRLHLKGLENFRATNGKVKLEASVSIQEGKVK